MTVDESDELLCQLIGIDSTSGSHRESEVLDFVSAWFAGRAASSVVRSADRPDALAVLPASRTQDGSSRLRQAEEQCLVFACHADVVPAGELHAWSSPPFEPTLRDGRVYGRGASDMKSGLAAAMIAVDRLHDARINAVLTVSTGEETGCLGAPAVVQLLATEGVYIGAIIIPESTDNRIVMGHRGALWTRIETNGVAAHGSDPDRGENAILATSAVLQRLDQVPISRHETLGAETLNVGTIIAGTVPNIVPDHCEIRVDHRVVDNDSARILNWWRAQPEVARVSVELDLAPVWTRPDDPWVRNLPAQIADAPATYFTDASVFVRSMPKVPMVVWGPGDPFRVHSVDESVALRSLYEAVELFVTAGHSWPESAG